jgi:hypothetical protein
MPVKLVMSRDLRPCLSIWDDATIEPGHESNPNTVKYKIYALKRCLSINGTKIEHQESTYTYHVGQRHEGTGCHVGLYPCSTEDRCWEEDDSIDARELLDQKQACPYTHNCKKSAPKKKEKKKVSSIVTSSHLWHVHTRFTKVYLFCNACWRAPPTTHPARHPQSPHSSGHQLSLRTH